MTTEERMEEYKRMREQEDTKLAQATMPNLRQDKHGNLITVPTEPRKLFIKARRILQ